jgi:autotransporter-associated beta strand protein
MVVDSGVLNVGAGGGAVMIGGGAGTPQSGKGSLVINGGTVNVGAAGTTAQTVDASRLWLMGYGNVGSSARIDLNGGMLSTARTIENGSSLSGSPVVNLNGGTLQAAAAINLIAAVSGRRTTVNVLSGGAIIDTQAFNASISEILRDGGGGGGLTKNGTGTLTLTGTNTYPGNTTVNAGMLSITSASLADDSTVTIANSAMLNLNFDQWGDVSDTVANLIIGTTQMPAGVYGAAGSGATSIDDTHFSGVGTLTVTSGPYDTWANGTHSPALTAKLSGDNQDGDSLNNLQEFAFGTQPTVFTGEIAYAAGTLTTPGAPKVVEASGTYSMVFGRRADYVTAGLIYKVQFSADLDTWVDNDDGTNPPVQVATDGTINAMSVPFVALITTPSGSQKPTFSRVQLKSTAPPPLPPPFPIESWALSNDDTSITLVVTSDNKLVMNQLMDPTDGWNWTGNSTYLPMLKKATVGGTTYNLKWVYNTATIDRSVSEGNAAPHEISRRLRHQP